MDTLDKLTELAYTHASQILIPTDQELMATFFLLKDNNDFDIYGCPWKNDQDKKAMVAKIGFKILGEDEPIVAYSLLSECWTSHYKEGEAKRADRPEHDPKRREVVVCATSDGTEHRMQSWQIGRDAKGRCVSLTSQPQDGGRYESWMLDVVDKALQLAEMKRKLQHGTGG